jgi:hypothetical protein
MHIGLCTVETGEPPEDGPGFLLHTGEEPGSSADPTALSLRLARLTEQLARDIRTLQRHPQARAVGLPEAVSARPLLGTLERLLRDWRSPPSRGSDRTDAHACIELVAGLEAAYCVLNGGRCFDPASYPTGGAEQVIDLGLRPPPERRPAGAPAEPIRCQTRNRSGGGVALAYRGHILDRPRVGQLIAARRVSGSAAWVLGVCRWLANEGAEGGFDMGLQYLTREARPVVVRRSAGLAADCAPALVTRQKHGAAPCLTLIVNSGCISVGERVRVYDQGRQYCVRCVELVEAGSGFERLRCLPV